MGTPGPETFAVSPPFPSLNLLTSGQSQGNLLGACSVSFSQISPVPEDKYPRLYLHMPVWAQGLPKRGGYVLRLASPTLAPISS